MIDIPKDVKQFVRNHFKKSNRIVSSDLTLFPAIHEESLDMNLIGYCSRNQAPVKLKSNWTARVDAHFIAGGRHFGTLDVADLAIMNSPTYGDIKYTLGGEFINESNQGGWKLEYFITDLMMACKEGIINDSPNFKLILRFLIIKKCRC